MKEMRRDQITGDLIIYSSYRNKRPHDTLIRINLVKGRNTVKPVHFVGGMNI